MDLNAIKTPSILVIGDIILDVYLSGASSRLSPEAPVPIVLINHDKFVLGGAANVSSNLKALGCDVAICGMIGNDSDGEIVRNCLKLVGISDKYVISTPDTPTINKTRIISSDQHVVRYDREKSFVNTNIREKFHDTVKEILQSKKFDAVIISDYNKGTITGTTIQDIKYYSGSSFVIADPKPGHKSFYSELDCITPNLQEISQMTGKSNVEEAALTLLNELKLKSIIVTMSEKGLYFLDRASSHYIESFKLETTERHHRMDVAGAGDTLISYYTAAMAAGFTNIQSLTISNIAAAIVVNKLGTATCSFDELLAEVEKFTRINKDFFKE